MKTIQLSIKNNIICNYYLSLRGTTLVTGTNQSICKDQSQFIKVKLIISIFNINDYIIKNEGF